MTNLFGLAILGSRIQRVLLRSIRYTVAGAPQQTIGISL